MFTLLMLSIMTGCREKMRDTGQPDPPVLDLPCDPLDPSLCGFPFPSSLYMVESNTSETGYQVAFPTGVLPNVNTRAADPYFWNERDGFSPLTPMLVHFDNLSLEGVVGHQNLADYLAEDAKTIVWDVESAERVPHFVELDMRHEDDERRAFILRPVKPIPWGHRVVVGIQNLKTTTGEMIEPSPAFQDLRDATDFSEFDVESRREHFEDVVFPALETAGIERQNLQLAWDFVVSSKQGTTQKLIHIRDDAQERHQNGETGYQIDTVQVMSLEEDARIAKKIYGKMMVPYYTEEPGPGSILSRGEDGMPEAQGTREIPFTVLVPHSVWNADHPMPILQYGHGLLGAQDEVEGSPVTQVAQDYGAVLLATDWSGLCSQDLNAVSQMMVHDIDRFAMVPERSQQGFIEAFLALEILKDQLSTDPELISPMGHSVVSSEDAIFYGNSMGGIFGLPYVAMNPAFDRATLGVTGASFSLLLPRSLNFGSFYGLLQNLYPDSLETALWLGLLQTLWDSSEPSGYLDSISRNPLPGNSSKQLLVQVGIGDAQVHTLGAHILMRGVGGGLISQPTRSIWGLEELEDATVGSGLMEWDYGMPEPVENVPPIRYENFDVHRTVRDEPLGQQQLRHFFATGELVNFCLEPCVSDQGVHLE